MRTSAERALVSGLRGRAGRRTAPGNSSGSRRSRRTPSSSTSSCHISTGSPPAAACASEQHAARADADRARDSVGDRVAGLDAGADDYLHQAVRGSGCSRASARSAAPGRAGRGRAPPASPTSEALDPLTREVRRAGREIELTRPPVQPARLFLRNPRQVLTPVAHLRARLGLRLRPSLELARRVRRLPAAQDRGRGRAAAIQTLRGVGYALRGDEPAHPTRARLGGRGRRRGRATGATYPDRARRAARAGGRHSRASGRRRPHGARLRDDGRARGSAASTCSAPARQRGRLPPARRRRRHDRAARRGGRRAPVSDRTLAVAAERERFPRGRDVAGTHIRVLTVPLATGTALRSRARADEWTRARPPAPDPRARRSRGSGSQPCSTSASRARRSSPCAA